jgi:hypothetical protein
MGVALEGIIVIKKIFTTKISLQSSNPTYSYPIIRLPRALKRLAGETVSIYQTEKDGSVAFFVVPKLDNLDKFVEGMDQEDQEPQEATIDQKESKNQWARPDSNRRPPPCQDGGF